jgi:hypothetical protein
MGGLPWLLTRLSAGETGSYPGHSITEQSAAGYIAALKSKGLWDPKSKYFTKLYRELEIQVRNYTGY